MDRNAFLAIALSFAVLSVWMMFTTPTPRPAPATSALEAPSQPGSAAPTAPAPVPAPQPVPAAPVPPPGPAPASERLEIATPLVRAVLASDGAALAELDLKQYRVAPAPTSPPVSLTTSLPSQPFALATPLVELGLGDLSSAPFAVESRDETGVVFRLERNGILVRKTYRFDPDSYLFELRLLVENHSSATVSPLYDLTWAGSLPPGHDFTQLAYEALHEGAVVTQPVAGFGVPGLMSRNPETEMTLEREIDWSGFNSTYFLAAMVPEDPTQASARIVATHPGKAGHVDLFFQPVSLPPGQSLERVYRVYAGPKQIDLLRAAGGSLESSINLGWSWVHPLTRAFAWLLHALYGVIPNYGVGIILLTILVRAVTTPLTLKQMKSMERMRALQPMIQELRDKYPDDRQKQSEEMMKLYRREGVNPLGGCLPMLLQLPVFVGLFYALQSSIDLRHAPFVGWIDDLSAPDELFMLPGIEIPFRVLPLLNGAAMVVQQKLQPTQVDPAQAKMMMIVMPVMMTVLFYQFPSGLVLYWTLSSVLAIVHQLWVGRGLRTATA